jgi:type 1 fimbriae regulatory protein FimE
MAFPIHPHMLRHGCGYALANTVRYTELAPDRFKDFWRD